ncbi:MAG: hypothetical protein WCH46_11280 [bacterium]
MLNRFLTILFLLLAEVVSAQHQPTWELVESRKMSSFDMLTTRTGAFAINDGGYHAIAKYENGKITDVFVAGDLISSVLIKDGNTVFFSVKNDGIYQSSNSWKNYTNIFPEPSATLLAVGNGLMLANLGTQLNYSSDGGATFIPSSGIPVTETITTAEVLNAGIAFALTGKKLYRTMDGGKTWITLLDTLVQTNTIYIDRTRNYIYIGGSRLLRSPDNGGHWDNITSLFFDVLPGPVIGAKDCSGAIYIGPDKATHGSDMYRSVDQGHFFQIAGPTSFSSIRMRKGVVLDRGSTIFYLDSSGLLSVVRDGIDSVISDSVRDRLVIQADTAVNNSLCPGTPATSFAASLIFDQCTGIVLDSLKQTPLSATFTAKFTPGFLGDTTVTIPMSFHATHSGPDTVHYKLKFHSPTTGNIETKFFDVVGFGVAGSPDIKLSTTEIDFPQTGIDSTHKQTLTISNPGCDLLVIDSVISSNPAVYLIEPKNYPLKIVPGKSNSVAITFNPHLEGEYLESAEIASNVGNKFVTLKGTATTHPVEGVRIFSEKYNIRIAPNPAQKIISLASDFALPQHLFLRDVLGREVLPIETGKTNNCLIDVSNFPNGYYFLDFGDGRGERIVIQH